MILVTNSYRSSYRHRTDEKILTSVGIFFHFFFVRKYGFRNKESDGRNHQVKRFRRTSTTKINFENILFLFLMTLFVWYKNKDK